MHKSIKEAAKRNDIQTCRVSPACSPPSPLSSKSWQCSVSRAVVGAMPSHQMWQQLLLLALLVPFVLLILLHDPAPEQAVPLLGSTYRCLPRRSSTPARQCPGCMSIKHT